MRNELTPDIENEVNPEVITDLEDSEFIRLQEVILRQLELLCPKDADCDTYVEDQLDDLYFRVNHMYETEGRLLVTPMETLGEVSRLLGKKLQLGIFDPDIDYSTEPLSGGRTDNLQDYIKTKLVILYRSINNYDSGYYSADHMRGEKLPRLLESFIPYKYDGDKSVIFTEDFITELFDIYPDTFKIDTHDVEKLRQYGVSIPESILLKLLENGLANNQIRSLLKIGGAKKYSIDVVKSLSSYPYLIINSLDAFDVNSLLVAMPLLVTSISPANISESNFSPEVKCNLIRSFIDIHGNVGPLDFGDLESCLQDYIQQSDQFSQARSPEEREKLINEYGFRVASRNDLEILLDNQYQQTVDMAKRRNEMHFLLRTRQLKDNDIKDYVDSLFEEGQFFRLYGFMNQNLIPDGLFSQEHLDKFVAFGCFPTEGLKSFSNINYGSFKNFNVQTREVVANYHRINPESIKDESEKYKVQYIQSLNDNLDSRLLSLLYQSRLLSPSFESLEETKKYFTDLQEKLNIVISEQLYELYPGISLRDSFFGAVMHLLDSKYDVNEFRDYVEGVGSLLIKLESFGLFYKFKLNFRVLCTLGIAYRESGFSEDFLNTVEYYYLLFDPVKDSEIFIRTASAEIDLIDGSPTLKFDTILKIRDSLQRDDAKPELLEKILPTLADIIALEGIQARSRRSEYDPWLTDFKPLYETIVKEDWLDITRPEDIAVLKEFFEYFGMVNSPRLLWFFIKIKKYHQADNFPKEFLDTIGDELGLDLEQILHNDPENVGLVFQSIVELRRNIASAVLSDDLEVIKLIGNSPVALELFQAEVGSSGFNSAVSDAEAIKTLAVNMELFPDQFTLPEGYEKIEAEVSEQKSIEVNNTEVDHLIGDLINNEDLQLQFLEYKKAFELHLQYTGNIDALIKNFKSNVIDYLNQQINDTQNLLNLETEKDSPNQGKLKGLEIKLSKLKGLHSTVIDWTYNSGDDISDVLNFTAINIPDKFVDKKLILQTLSLFDIADKFPQAKKELFDRSVSGDALDKDSVKKMNEFLSLYIKEHWLNESHALEQEKIGSVDNDALRQLRKAWGVSNFENGIINVVSSKIYQLEKGKAGDKKKSITFVPSRATGLVFTGHLGRACTSNQNRALANGEIKNIVSFTVATNFGQKTQKLNGSFVLIETQTAKGESVIVLRANNPSENLLGQVSSDDLVDSIIKAAKDTAARRGIKRVLVPLDGSSRSSSNRPLVSQFYQEHFAGREKIQLENLPETNFNGYPIWNSNGGNAVVEV